MIFYTSIKNYDKKIIKENIEKIFYNFGIKLQHEKVLLKPNLISPKNSKKAVNTHPAVVEAIAEVLKDNGNSIYIGDSPGVGTLNLNLKVAGYSDFIKKLGIKIFHFNKSVEIKRYENKILKHFKISSAIYEFNHIINIAKLKTHIMTGMTLSVKNLYGFIVGKEKILYHLKAGHNREMFADILIDIYETVNPMLNIVDGITGMEGNGPTSGTPKMFNLLAASENGYALDRAIEKYVGFRGKTVISKQAESRGFLNENLLKIIKGDFHILHAKTKSASFNMPKFLTDIFSIKPTIDKNNCKRCMKCMESCPPKAITDNNELLSIDYSKCIRCFCCHELCVHNAVKLKRFVI